MDEQVDFVKDAISSAEVNFLEAPDEESQKERRARSMAEERASLPIYPYRQQLLDAIREEQILIIVGETGSGKTTQIMQYLLEDGYCDNGVHMCVCACVCPRTVTATTVERGSGLWLRDQAVVRPPWAQAASSMLVCTHAGRWRQCACLLASLLACLPPCSPCSPPGRK